MKKKKLMNACAGGREKGKEIGPRTQRKQEWGERKNEDKLTQENAVRILLRKNR